MRYRGPCHGQGNPPPPRPCSSDPESSATPMTTEQRCRIVSREGSKFLDTRGYHEQRALGTPWSIMRSAAHSILSTRAQIQPSWPPPIPSANSRSDGVSAGSVPSTPHCGWEEPGEVKGVGGPSVRRPPRRSSADSQANSQNGVRIQAHLVIRPEAQGDWRRRRPRRTGRRKRPSTADCLPRESGGRRFHKSLRRMIGSSAMERRMRFPPSRSRLLPKPGLRAYRTIPR